MALFLSTLDQIVAPNVISCSLASRRDDMSSTLRFAAWESAVKKLNWILNTMFERYCGNACMCYITELAECTESYDFHADPWPWWDFKVVANWSTSRAAKNSLACVRQFLQAKHLGWHWSARIVWPYMLQSRTSFSFQAWFQADLLNICLYDRLSRFDHLLPLQICASWPKMGLRRLWWQLRKHHLNWVFSSLQTEWPHRLQVWSTERVSVWVKSPCADFRCSISW